MRIRNRNPTRWDGLGQREVGHLRWCSAEIGNEAIVKADIDTLPARMMWNRKYIVDKESFKSGEPGYDRDAIVCYTDGSKVNKQAGWGTTICDHKEKKILKEGQGQDRRR